MARKKAAAKTSGSVKPPAKRFTLVRDSREKAGQGWDFPAGEFWAGTEVRGLQTGDYTLVGYEHLFRVERKGSAGEFWGNLTNKTKWANFKAEMERLEEFPAAFLVLEFSMPDVVGFPKGLPWGVRRKMRVTRGYFLRRFLELQMTYRTKVVMAGPEGREVFTSLTKRVVERWPDPPPPPQ